VYLCTLKNKDNNDEENVSTFEKKKLINTGLEPEWRPKTDAEYWQAEELKEEKNSLFQMKTTAENKLL